MMHAKIFVELYGPDSGHKLQSQLTGELGKRLSTASLVPSAWYPIDWYDQLLRATAAVSTDPEGPLIRKLARATVAHDMRGPYKVLLKLISPQMLLTWAPCMMGHYYNGGEMSVIDSKPGDISVEFRQWHGCTARIWQTILAASEAGMVAAGAKAAQGDILRGGGADEAVMRFKWS